VFDYLTESEPMRVLVLTLILLATGCTETQSVPTPITIQTPDGDFTAQKSIGEPVPQKVDAITGDALKRLEALSAQGPGFVATYLPNTPKEPDLKDYDLAFRAWQTSKSPQHSKEQVVEILGGYLGTGA
jgi:hypothetical protein